MTAQAAYGDRAPMPAGTGPGAAEESPVGRKRRFADRQDLAAVVRAGLGTGRRLAAVERLRGGSKKGVPARTGLMTGACGSTSWQCTCH